MPQLSDKELSKYFDVVKNPGAGIQTSMFVIKVITNEVGMFHY